MGRKPTKRTCDLAIVVDKVATKSVQAPAVKQKNMFQWKDKASGDYYHASSGFKSDGNHYYRYHNVSIGNKSDGYSKRFFVEEKFQSIFKGGGKKPLKSLKYYY